jgi:H+/Cl- antiporter ClcA
VALVILGLACGAAGRVFVAAVDFLRHRLAAVVPYSWLRPAVGGLATLVLAALVGRDSLGLSLPLIADALAGTESSWTRPLLKLVFTVIAVGSGFVGGEVTPLFVVGSTIGAAIADLTLTDAATTQSLVILVGCGLVTVFASAAGVWLVGVVMAVELFGWPIALPAALAGGVARVVGGAGRLYVTVNETGDRHVVAPVSNP